MNEQICFHCGEGFTKSNGQIIKWRAREYWPQYLAGVPICDGCVLKVYPEAWEKLRVWPTAAKHIRERLLMVVNAIDKNGKRGDNRLSIALAEDRMKEHDTDITINANKQARYLCDALSMVLCLEAEVDAFARAAMPEDAIEEIEFYP